MDYLLHKMHFIWCWCVYVNFVCSGVVWGLPAACDTGLPLAEMPRWVCDVTSPIGISANRRPVSQLAGTLHSLLALFIDETL